MNKDERKRETEDKNERQKREKKNRIRKNSPFMHTRGTLCISLVFTSTLNKTLARLIKILSIASFSSIPTFSSITTLSSYSFLVLPIFLPFLLFSPPYASPIPPPSLPPPPPPLPPLPFLPSQEHFLQRLCTIPSRVEVKCFAGEHDSKQPLTVNEISSPSTLNAGEAGGVECGRNEGGVRVE